MFLGHFPYDDVIMTTWPSHGSTSYIPLMSSIHWHPHGSTSCIPLMSSVHWHPRALILYLLADVDRLLTHRAQAIGLSKPTRLSDSSPLQNPIGEGNLPCLLIFPKYEACNIVGQSLSGSSIEMSHYTSPHGLSEACNTVGLPPSKFTYRVKSSRTRSLASLSDTNRRNVNLPRLTIFF